MMNALLRINPELSEIHQSSFDIGPALQGWQVTMMSRTGLPVAGGFAMELHTARKIAAAEYVERSMVKRFGSNADDRKRWCLDTHPSACGFAAGFDKNNVKLRSYLEGLERWAMSLWIDNALWLEEVPGLAKPGPLEQYLLKMFEKVRFFRKQLPVIVGTKVIPIEIGFAVAFDKDGAFPGSAAKVGSQGLWSHALMECYRHWLLAKNNQDNQSFPFNKIAYFAHRRSAVEELLDSPRSKKWPAPVVEHFNETQVGEFFLARTIFDGWVPWTNGALDRFLY